MRDIDPDDVDNRSAKLFADGALGSWGAALLEPYTGQNDKRRWHGIGAKLVLGSPLDDPTTRGILRSPEAVFKPLVAQVSGD